MPGPAHVATIAAGGVTFAMLMVVVLAESGLEQWLPVSVLVLLFFAFATRGTEATMSTALGLAGAAVSSVTLYALMSEGLASPLPDWISWSIIAAVIVWGVIAPTWWYTIGTAFGWAAALYLADAMGPTCEGDLACALPALLIMIGLILTTPGVVIRKTIDYHHWRHPEHHHLWPSDRAAATHRANQRLIHRATSLLLSESRDPSRPRRR
jgi:hypothetical protein